MKKKFQKKVKPKILKNSLFFSVLAFLCFFGSAIYYLLFHRSMRVIFALKIAAFFAGVLATFCHFLPFFLLALLRYVRNCAAWRLSPCSTYPPLYRRSRNKSNPKKNFFIFFNIDIWRNFYFLFFFIFFLHFGPLLWWIAVCVVVLCL